MRVLAYQLPVSRSGSADTNSTRGRVASGIDALLYARRTASARMVGLTSGQWVKPMNTSVSGP